jgi:hypothetical protein
MKSFVATVAVCSASLSLADESSPVSKVLDLLSGLESKIIDEGASAQREYDEYAEWCEDRSRNVGFEIKTGKSNVAELQAFIDQDTALASAFNTKLEELAGSLASDDADLTAASDIRKKESADFTAEKSELTETISVLERAIGILQREMRKGGASMMQLKTAQSLTEAFRVMVQASMFSADDAKTLTAFVQNSQQAGEDADEEESSAPAAAVYVGQSGGIIDTLDELLEKAQSQLEDAQHKEVTATHNFQMLKQSLDDQIKYSKKEMADSKKNLASSEQHKAIAQGDLAVTSTDLAEDSKTLGSLHQNCMTRAQDFEAATKSRAEELKALAAAKKVISETTGGAEAITYDQSEASSFLQSGSSRLSSGTDLANFEAVRLVRDLARKHHSAELAQLASRMASAMRLSSGDGQDPFAKVKGLLSDMIERLESEGGADASHKAYCDKELSYTTGRKEEKAADIAKLSTQIDAQSARSAQLKEEVSALQKELYDLAKSQSEWNKFRQEEHTAFLKNQAEMQKGLEGIKMALKVLRDYYSKSDAAHGSADGAATGIIGLIEVAESDFSKGLAEMVATEENAEATYEAATKEAKVTKTTKNQDIRYKSKESVALDKAESEARSDRSGVQTEQDAVTEYLKKLEEMCIAKAEPYAEKASRRAAEIAGLKEALSILEGEAVLLQSQQSQQQQSRSLRGLRRHALA